MPHTPNFSSELAEWWSRPQWEMLVGPGRSFFMFCYRKGWIPISALTPLAPFAALFVICIIMLFIGPFPNPIIGATAVGMLACLVWLMFSIGKYCRLALIDIAFLAIPVALLVWGSFFT